MAHLDEITSERGNTLLVNENFKYYKSKLLRTGETKWRCAVRSCSAKIYSKDNNNNKREIRKVGEHNHSVDMKKLQRQIISAEAKRKAIEDINEKPSKLFNGILQNIETSKTLTKNDVVCIKKNAYRARKKIYNMQELPETSDFLQIELNLCTEECLVDPLKTDEDDDINVIYPSDKYTTYTHRSPTKEYVEDTRITPDSPKESKFPNSQSSNSMKEYTNGDRQYHHQSAQYRHDGSDGSNHSHSGAYDPPRRQERCDKNSCPANHRPPFNRRPVTRNSNILSAVLCLVKELDYPSLEVVEMAVRCRMDELEE